MNKLRKVLDIIEHKHLDAIIVLSDYNRRYLSDFTGTSGALIITPKKQYLITDFRYIDQATEQAQDFEIINRKSSLISEIKSILERENLSNIGFEGHLISYDTYVELNKGLITLISISNEIDKIREIKNKEEIQLIQKAAKIVDQTYEYILTQVSIGMTEREIKAKLESKMLELGADGPSFDTIVASGYRGALPHGVASDKRIEKGDMITLDFGAYYRGCLLYTSPSPRD